MPGNSFGEIFRITTWGESHGKAIGVVIDGCPAGFPLYKEDIQRELDRRKPGQSEVTSPRKESDEVEILSGVFEGKTTGAPISLIVENKDVDSSIYEDLRDLFRPGHADYTYQRKYGIRDYRGGGRSSARETVGRVSAGAVAKKVLGLNNITIIGYTLQIGNIKAEKIDLGEIEKNEVRCPDRNAAEEMIKRILKVKRSGDSIGGIVEVVARGVPPGLGEPVFDKLDGDIGKAMMSIGAVKGIEIGAGFGVASMIGSKNNDEFYNNKGVIATRTNNAGGILGGISTGEEIKIRIAVKPTPSIAKTQGTVNIKGDDSTIVIHGRHDACICHRIIPVAEAMMALVLTDHLLRNRLAKIS
ncbi:MAG: chorismate synthase [Nitrospinae bacterium]|nr:chorismate synthase [Nitrospinota bacterium]